MRVSLTLDTTRVMRAAVGPHGLTEADLCALAPRAARAHRWLERWRGAGETFFDLPDRHGLAGCLARDAAGWRARFRNFVVLGIGGSALGARCLHSALCHPFHNELPDARRAGCRLYVLDNVDPDLLRGLLDVLAPEDTLVNVITKSGDTAETMSQLCWIVSLLRRRLGPQYREHLIATTDVAKGHLRAFADAENLASYVVPAGVGGRFSVLSPVGLVPAAAAGIDVLALLAGAKAMRAACAAPELAANPAYLLAAVHYLLERKRGKHLSVMMPYSHRLRDFADWYRQLWAESLGKRRHRDGQQEVGVGPTPIKALGVTDQHSQVQLYVEGPNDKVITFLRVVHPDRDLRIPRPPRALAALDYLGGRRFGELLASERTGTEYALTAARRPNLTVTVPRVDAAALGELFFLYEVATAFAGALYEVNPFDQPGVELGKVMTYADMGRAGYDEQRAQLRAQKVGPRRGWGKGTRLEV